MRELLNLIWRTTTQDMHLIIATFSIQKENLPLMDGHAQLENLLLNLSNAAPELVWHRLARAVAEGTRGWIPFLSKDRYLRQAARDIGDDQDIGPATDRGFAANLTTARSEADWNQGGHIMLKFSPRTGVAQIQISELGSGHERTYQAVRDIFVNACLSLDVRFAKCDVDAPNTAQKSMRKTIYSVDKRVFPHREFLGWMGFVKKELSAHDIPEADELIPIEGKLGTMIVSVSDRFDVHSPRHIEKAQRVEMRLVDLDALPIIDPRFLK